MWGKIRAGLSQISPDRVEEQQHTVRVFELEGGLNIHVALRQGVKSGSGAAERQRTGETCGPVLYGLAEVGCDVYVCP